MPSSDATDDNPWGDSVTIPAHGISSPPEQADKGVPAAIKPWSGKSSEFSVSRGMPYKSFSTRPIPTHSPEENQDTYVEPEIEITSTSYPPPAPNPFASTRSKVEPSRPQPVHSTSETSTLAKKVSIEEEGVGPEGPLSYAWNPKGSGKVVLGLAVVDFNHLVGPTVEYSYPPSLTASLHRDEELCKRLPFLALPDGAHLSEEDYSYFHCVYNPLTPDGSFTQTKVTGGVAEEEGDELPQHQTLFGISCNRQLPSSELINRPADVTRSTVQKAVVVLASRPIFGPIRDKLGVVTRAFFAQRDFTQTDLLSDLYRSLETGLMGKENEAAMYIGTSLRELVHKFRHRTLTLVKMLMLQKRIMFFGYPVERLCTYQYSLISLMPGLLMNLADAGSPDLDFRAGNVNRPTSLRTSDRNSLLRYMGLPLHTFGEGGFFQPYLPLQQIDMLASDSWLVGTTNSIVTQQRDCQWDLLVNIEQNTFEFHDSKIEKMVSLTPSDRAWMDGVIRSVEETWNSADPTRTIGMAYHGSDDDLRSRFEEYICSALSAIKYSDFMASGQATDPVMMGMPGDPPALKPDASTLLQPFSESWMNAFRQTPACKVWEASTDPLLFDICEPRHPSEGKASAISDIGIRLTEGLHDLHLDQQLAPTREAIESALAVGSSTLFRAFDGVRNEVNARLKERELSIASGGSSTSGSRPISIVNVPITNTTPISASEGQRIASSVPDFRAAIGGIGSFFGSKVASFQQAAALRVQAQIPTTPPPPDRKVSGLRSFTLQGTSPPPAGAGSGTSGNSGVWSNGK